MGSNIFTGNRLDVVMSSPRGVSPTRLFQFMLFVSISSRIEAADPRIDITASGARSPFCYDTPSEVFQILYI